MQLDWSNNCGMSPDLLESSVMNGDVLPGVVLLIEVAPESLSYALLVYDCSL